MATVPVTAMKVEISSARTMSVSSGQRIDRQLSLA